MPLKRTAVAAPALLRTIRFGLVQTVAVLTFWHFVAVALHALHALRVPRAIH